MEGVNFSINQEPGGSTWSIRASHETIGVFETLEDAYKSLDWAEGELRRRQYVECPKCHSILPRCYTKRYCTVCGTEYPPFEKKYQPESA